MFGKPPGCSACTGTRCARCWPTQCRQATGDRSRCVDPTLRQAQDKPFTGVIDAILEGDSRVPRKQRHTAKRVFERLKDEYGFTGQYTIVNDYVRERGHRNRNSSPSRAPPGGWVSCAGGPPGFALHSSLAIRCYNCSITA